VNNIKKLLIGLPLFNFFVIVILWRLEVVEKLRPMTEDSAPMTVGGAISILLLLGGFAVCGFCFGLFKAIKYDNGLKGISIQIIILTIIIWCMYIFYFSLTLKVSAFSFNNNTFSLTSITTLEQILGYVVGSSIGLLIKTFKNKHKFCK
jgi:hypothetical protein